MYGLSPMMALSFSLSTVRTTQKEIHLNSEFAFKTSTGDANLAEEKQHGVKGQSRVKEPEQHDLPLTGLHLSGVSSCCGSGGPGREECLATQPLTARTVTCG